MGRTRVVFDCGGITRPTAETIDQLACLQIAARRNDCELELAGAQPCLLELLDLCGLAEVLGLEFERQAEQREELLGVEEEGELPYPAA
jgi:anti-anti-sigma regulatory factor